MKHILGEAASSGMVPAYTAFSVLLTVLHSPQAHSVSVSHPYYNFGLHCTEVTMSQKEQLTLSKIANYGSLRFPIRSQLQVEITKIRLKFKMGEGCWILPWKNDGRRWKKRDWGILHHLRGRGEMVWRVWCHLCGLGQCTSGGGYLDSLLWHGLSSAPHVSHESMLWNFSYSDLI